jgi:hypothetical protein
MNAQKASGVSRAERWRAHCEQIARRLGRFRGGAQAVRRVELLEAEMIECLCAIDLAVEARAVALRTIVELRDCTAREVATFFAIEPDVVIRGLSLLAEARGTDRVSEPAAPSSRSRRKSRVA